MAVLEAILAFAITMLVLAMIASGMTEMLHRYLSLRAQGLRRMLDSLYDDALAKVLPEELKQAIDTQPGSDVDAVLEAFKRLGTRGLAAVATLDPQKATPEELWEVLRKSAADDEAGAVIRARIERAVDKGDNLLKAIRPFLFKNKVLETLTENRTYGPEERTRSGLLAWTFAGGFRATHVGKLTADEFLQRLASGSLGEHIDKYLTETIKEAAGKINSFRNDFFDDLARRFESYGSEVSLWFQARSLLTTMLMGLVVAFVVHADAFVLMRTFTSNPELSRAVITQFERRQADIERTLGQPPATLPPATDVAQLRAEFEKKLAEGRKEVDSLVTLGVPIGWTKYNANAPGGNEHRGNARYLTLWKDFHVPYPANLSIWFGIVIGGLMIGLGAPFWYDLVKNLSNVRRLVGAVDDMLPAGLSSTERTSGGHRRGDVEPLAAQRGTTQVTDRQGDVPPSRNARLFDRSRFNATERWGGSNRTGGQF